MLKAKPAESPDAYVKALRGWRKEIVAALREAAKKTAFDETIKWGNIVYLKNGPALLIRAEEDRVLFDFWRGMRLAKLDPLLKPSGKYEMATRVFMLATEAAVTMPAV